MIRLLPPSIASKIAAGEVIERPASVVKELVENAIDANATEISITTKAGGVAYIRVTDDGVGIAKEDVTLAFQRFATSKVSDERVLDAIKTLGFRGEALPSIAAVSRISFSTKTSGADYGIRVDMVEGNIVDIKPEGIPLGTTITVQDLFKNVPARRKFLRSMAAETSRIQVMIYRYAAAYPEIKFRLDCEGSRKFSTNGSGNLVEVISNIYTPATAQAMLDLKNEVDSQEPIVSVEGMISSPNINRASRNAINFFVNRRWVQSRMLNYAVTQAYHGFLKDRRYPLAIIHIGIPYEDVDVNVHPAKTEVRFRQENHVFAMVQQRVRQVLTAQTPIPSVLNKGSSNMRTGPRQGSHTFWAIEPSSQKSLSLSKEMQHNNVTNVTPNDASPLLPKSTLPVLRVIGQIKDTYIVAEGPDGMYLIDQHASHERIVYERIVSRAASKLSEVQSLLEPITIELSPEHHEILQTQKDDISHIGFLIEPFGGHTCLVRGVPSLLSESDIQECLIEVLDVIANGGDVESWEERAAYSLACHGAIRAGKTLSRDEMAELTRQLEHCIQPHTCPHGRPTIIHFGTNHIEREFGRR